jgi:hypothetical protein
MTFKRVAIVGSRRFPDPERVRVYVAGLPNGSVVVSGGAWGVDTIAEKEARALGIPVRIYQPHYDRFGASAPLMRNQEIVDDCDRLVAFWDGESTGTMHTVGLARKAGKPVEIIEVRR